jgi:phosphatidylglycerol:prolipoprotein diacylglycerol transferase
MAEPKLFFKHPMAYFDLGQGGFAFYGGVILASVGLLAWLAIARMPLLKVADLCAPAVLLGDSLGRVGCFFAGCCHGRPVGLNATSTLLRLQGGEIVTVGGFPWVALIYRKDVGVGDIFDVPIYPTQLWESLGTLTLVIFLSWMWAKHRRFDGQVAGFTLLLYAMLRYTVESVRGDTVRGVGYLGYFSTSQMVSFAMFALGAGLLVWRAGRGVAPEKPLTDEDEELLA